MLGVSHWRRKTQRSAPADVCLGRTTLLIGRLLDAAIWPWAVAWSIGVLTLAALAFRGRDP